LRCGEEVKVTLLGVAQSGDVVATLEELRDRLAAEIDECDSKRDLAALALRLTDVVDRLGRLPTKKATGPADEIAQRRVARRGANTSGQTHSAVRQK